MGSGISVYVLCLLVYSQYLKYVRGELANMQVIRLAVIISAKTNLEGMAVLAQRVRVWSHLGKKGAAYFSSPGIGLQLLVRLNY